jgi:hypothetical protein
VKKYISVFSMAVAIALSSLVYVAPAQAGCSGWDVGCKVKAEAKKVKKAAAAVKAAAEKKAKAVKAAAEKKAKAVKAAAEKAAKAAEKAAKAAEKKAKAVKAAAEKAAKAAEKAAKAAEKKAKAVKAAAEKEAAALAKAAEKAAKAAEKEAAALAARLAKDMKAANKKAAAQEKKAIAGWKPLMKWKETPLKKKDIGLVQLTIKNWGGIYSDSNGYTSQEAKIVNTTRLNFSGVALDLVAKCEVKAATTINVCIDMLTAKVSGKGGSDVSCTVVGLSGIPSIPGLSANTCLNMSVSGKIGKKPKGSVEVRVEANALDYEFNKRVFRAKF